ncbi:DUF4349 domain-containing protein [Luteimonas aquatica]|uniref:DUF4349 domain-containing protein n=1 Tax=Luteimonas aquatica TaxID=450364 RepID=UPI001F5A7845|nr:DUF4349 domain-containing protein [Luteimonas aquatica]
MRGMTGWMVLLLAAGGLAACGQNQESMALGGYAPADMNMAAPAAGGGPPRAQAMLAYEHDVEIRLAAERIPERLRAAQAACNAGKFGECVVLNVNQRGGDSLPGGSLTVRIVPAGVEPMIKLASDGAELGSRSTRAEDLAVVVRDNNLAQERLRKERERLQEFQARRDLAVADMIALSKQLAETEAQLEATEQQGAQHRRRIDTQLLTMNFQAPGGESGRNEIGQAFHDFGEILSSGTAWLIRAFAFLIPLAILLFVLVLVIRRIRRRRK